MRQGSPNAMRTGGKYRLFLWLIVIASQTGALACAEDRVLFRDRSAFNEIIVCEDDSGVRSLLFREYGARQTAIDTVDRRRLVLAYTRAAMIGLAVVPHPRKILVVGLGGGAMPTFLRRNFPDATIDLAELDPAVMDVAKRFFFFAEDVNMKVHIGDGRNFIENCRGGYDIIFLDAYGIDYIPYALATREFLLAVKIKLSAEGIVVGNVWGMPSNELYFSMVKTYRDVFPELHIIRAPLSSNHILISSARRLNLTPRRLVQLAVRIENKLKPPLELARMVEEGYEPVGDLPKGARILLDADEPRQ